MIKLNKKTILYICLSAILSFALLFVDFKDKDNLIPKEVYRVYLSGKPLGLIESKEELEDYIDQEQELLKKKYNVDKVYLPKDLDIVKEVTYEDQIYSTQYIYNKIKDITPFTISGYTVTIHGIKEQNQEQQEVMTKAETIYVLDKKIFTNSVDKTIRSFIPSEEYDSFLNETQKEIEDTGRYIEDISIENNITIKKDNIPTDKMIFTNEEDLSKFLLFGTLDEQQKYTVQTGDTIEDVSFANKISTEEFLIANPDFKNADSLLYPGQEVTLGILQPKFKTIEEEHVVELQEEKYETEVRYDNSMMIGKSETIQAGENGINKVTTKVQKANGAIVSAYIASTEEIKPAVKEIVVRGGNSGYYNPIYAGDWAWPTNSPYIITSVFGWRWGQLHDGLDISGTGEGSPIRAVGSGTIVASSYERWPNGNYVYVDHGNGYISTYLHLSARYVSVGEHVEKGQVIGAMGHTGWATGTHLHLGLFKGGYPYRGGTAINPMALFR